MKDLQTTLQKSSEMHKKYPNKINIITHKEHDLQN